MSTEPRAAGAAGTEPRATWVAVTEPRATWVAVAEPRAAWVAVAAIVFAFAWGLGEIRTRTGWDDTWYLLQASSLVEDGDLDLRNDALYSALPPDELRRFLTTTLPSGTLKNTFSIGPAVLWLPAYAAGMPWREGTGTAAAMRWSRAQLAALHLLSLACLAGVAWFLVRLLETAGAGRRLAVTAMLALLLGTPLAVYGPALYTMAHLPSALAASLLVASLLWLERDPRPYRALLAGVALGLVFLVRWQDAVFGILLAVPLAPLLAGKRRDWRRLAQLLAAAAAGCLAMASLQLHAWRLELGAWLAMPQGGQYMHWMRPRLGAFLFSGFSGLLPWSPVFAVAAAGLLLPWRCRLSPRWRLAALAVLAAEIYLNAAVRDWWGGDSFGARRMTSCVPLLAIGLANLAALAAGSRRWRWPLVLLLGALCLWGCFSVYLYWGGVRDLPLVLLGTPSAGARSSPEAPGAQDAPEAPVPPVPPENTAVAVNDPAAARQRAFRLALPAVPVRYGPHNYCAGLVGVRRSFGILLTAVLMAGVAAGTCCLLAGARGRLPLQAALLAVLATVLWCHGLLARGPRPDRAERAVWQRIAAAWEDPSRQLAAAAPMAEQEADLLEPRVGPRCRAATADAYRTLAMLASWEAEDPRRAYRQLDRLAARAYPAAAGLRQRIAALGPGIAVLRLLPGAFFTPLPRAAFRAIPLPAATEAQDESATGTGGDGGKDGAAAKGDAGGAEGAGGAGDAHREGRPDAAGGMLETTFDLRLADLEPGATYDVATLQDRNRAELVRVTLQGGGAVRLVTPRETVTAPLRLANRPLYHLRLCYDPQAGRASLAVTGQDGRESRLGALLPSASAEPDRLLLGRDRRPHGHASFPLWSSAFSELWLTAETPVLGRAQPSPRRWK